jgi:hypothetical protein
MTTLQERARELRVTAQNDGYLSLHHNYSRLESAITALLTQVQAEARLAALEEARKVADGGSRFTALTETSYWKGRRDAAQAIAALSQAAHPAPKEGE